MHTYERQRMEKDLINWAEGDPESQARIKEDLEKLDDREVSEIWHNFCDPNKKC